MADLTTIRQTYPDAYVRFDQTAKDCGYPRYWMVWSHNDSDMRLLGEGTTEAEALTDALTNLED